MASAAPLRDIDEKFLQCIICLNQLRDPKILPCLHRYCRECIGKIAPEDGKEIECPTCREKHPLPDGGTDSLKTDFNTKNIIDFIQLQDSVKHEPMKVCANCSERLKVASFCFRCNDFLCQRCDEHHRTSKIVRDHRSHIFSLSEVEARNLTIVKLSSLKEGPRCRHHQERAADICCTTCGNLPICMPCTHGRHQGHTLKEVGSLAIVEREKLTAKVKELMQYMDKVYQMQANIGRAAVKLRRRVDEEKRNLQEHIDAGERKAKEELGKKERKLKQRQTELGENLEKRISARKKILDEKMRRATEEYDKACDEDRREVSAGMKELQEEIEREKKHSQQKLEVANVGIKELLKSVENQEEEKSEKIREVSGHFDLIVKRFEIANTTASSILEAEYDWTDVQCIPDVCAAIDPLVVEVKREFPVLEGMTELKVGRMSSTSAERGVRVDITEREVVVNVEGITKGWTIDCITSNGDGTICITGYLFNGKQSHVTVTNWKGQTLRQGVYESHRTSPCRFCDFLSTDHIATVCEPNEIGVYGIRNGSHETANICDILTSWPADRDVTCVAADSGNGHILVGGRGSREVAVFNSDLKHIHTMTLPAEIKWPEDMTIHGKSNSLLVCDYEGGRAYAVTKEGGSVCEIKYEFTRPTVDGHDWWPISVCTDENGFVYMLWVAYVGYINRNICAQYSQNGGQLLTTRSLSEDYFATCLATVKTEQGEKLVVPIGGGKLMAYGLVVNKQ